MHSSSLLCVTLFVLICMASEVLAASGPMEMVSPIFTYNSEYQLCGVESGGTTSCTSGAIPATAHGVCVQVPSTQSQIASVLFTCSPAHPSNDNASWVIGQDLMFANNTSDCSGPKVTENGWILVQAEYGTWDFSGLSTTYSFSSSLNISYEIFCRWRKDQAGGTPPPFPINAEQRYVSGPNVYEVCGLNGACKRGEVANGEQSCVKIDSDYSVMLYCPPLTWKGTLDWWLGAGTTIYTDTDQCDDFNMKTGSFGTFTWQEAPKAEGYLRNITNGQQNLDGRTWALYCPTAISSDSSGSRTPLWRRPMTIGLTITCCALAIIAIIVVIAYRKRRAAEGRLLENNYQAA